MRSRFTRFALALVALSFLTACTDSWFGEKEAPPLPGKRLSVMQLAAGLEADPKGDAPFEAVPVTSVPDWPGAGGQPAHVNGHADLRDGALKEKWSADTGSGSHRKNPLTAQPVVLDDRVFTLDTKGELRAFDLKTGALIWQVFAGPAQDDSTTIGGGIAASRDLLYVTNGYPEVIAVKIADGSRVWRAPLPNPARAAPTVRAGQVYVTTLDNQIFALQANTGTQVWSYQGFEGGLGLLGAAAPAADDELVVVPFSSGEVIALRPVNGAVAWSDNLSPAVHLGGAGGLADMRALPLLDQGQVISMTYAGRLVATDARTGMRIWQKDIGGVETPWLAGPYLFVLTGDQQVVALDRANGRVRWVVPLPAYESPEDHTGPITWTGPLYAGGRLLVASSEGHLLHLSPDTGKVLLDQDIGVTPAVPMLVAGHTLYILSDGGTLHAFE